MCLAVPGKVLELSESAPDMARVDVAGLPRDVNLSLLPEADRPRPGGWVLVHAGFALSPVPEAEAIELLGILEELTRPPEQAGVPETPAVT